MRRSNPADQPPGFPKPDRSGPGVVAWLAAGVGMSVFALAAVALVARVITEEQFWLSSAVGLALYLCAHCLGVSYHS